MGREQREHVRNGVDLRDPLPRSVRQLHEASPDVAGELLETPALGPAACEDEDDAWIACGRDRADQRVEPLLRRKTGDGEDGDVLGRDSCRAAELVPPVCNRVGPLTECRDVDRVREDVEPRGIRAARAHRLAREGPDDEDVGGAPDDRRDDRALQRPAPARALVAVVRLDEQDVGHAAEAAPRDRGL